MTGAAILQEKGSASWFQIAIDRVGRRLPVLYLIKPYSVHRYYLISQETASERSAYEPVRPISGTPTVCPLDVLTLKDKYTDNTDEEIIKFKLSKSIPAKSLFILTTKRVIRLRTDTKDCQKSLYEGLSPLVDHRTACLSQAHPYCVWNKRLGQCISPRGNENDSDEELMSLEKCNSPLDSSSDASSNNEIITTCNFQFQNHLLNCTCSTHSFDSIQLHGCVSEWNLDLFHHQGNVLNCWPIHSTKVLNT
ncbi:hypothetical protein Ciccas_009751 [Cichlidogyrus casuarinus]|uniref:Uncharacterized protein n=1 Tax=Cichlidogyrus casuarinus TaxID=1844966 RepID=A0ABD2PWK8_9PLAT